MLLVVGRQQCVDVDLEVEQVPDNVGILGAVESVDGGATRIERGHGRTVDFRNTVLIMTSNLGTADLRKANLGFAKADEAVSYERMKAKVQDALKAHFKPEFLNRIDDTIVFHELTVSEVTRIVDLMIRRLSTQLAGQGLGLELTDAAKEFLAREGYDPTMGARPLRRSIQRLVEDPLSERLLNKEFTAGEIIVVDIDKADDAETADGQVALRHRVDLSVRAIQRRQDQRAAAQGLGLADVKDVARTTPELVHP